ncbi:MAG: hypothetical protein OXC48_11925, partial [Endozoicomonadaceae bacterium]|nr:hypothetical protein [Endozoicomonadaceae bacterium]
GLRIANAIATFGFGFIHKQWANIVGSVVTGVISAASVGFGALAVLRDPTKAGFAAAIFAGLFSVSLMSVLQTKSKAMAIIGAITGSIAVLTTFAVDSAALGVGLVKGVQRIAGMWRLADVAEELSSEDIAEQLGVIPLRVLKSTESPVSLREELPENLAEKLLNENPHLMISEGNGTDYLILHSDEDVDEAVSALKNVRSMDDNVATLFTASKLSQKLVNLNSVDEYLTTMEQSDRRYSLLGPFVSETEREAAGKLFEPFGPMKFNRISQIPEDLSSDIDNLRFIGRNMRGAFVAYTDQNNDYLIVAKYSHMQGIIVRISVRSDDSVYRSVEAYTVF